MAWENKGMLGAGDWSSYGQKRRLNDVSRLSAVDYNCNPVTDVVKYNLDYWDSDERSTGSNKSQFTCIVEEAALRQRQGRMVYKGYSLREKKKTYYDWSAESLKMTQHSNSPKAQKSQYNTMYFIIPLGKFAKILQKYKRIAHYQYSTRPTVNWKPSHTPRTAS